jgi:hypothetical protein
MILTDTFEVWLPMPGQDIDTPPGQKRYYLRGTFTDQGDALSASRDASGGAVTRVSIPAGMRTIVSRP